MPPVGQPDISSLSDEALAQILKDYGVDVGPINVATRRTYERRLLKLQTGVIPPNDHQYQPANDEDDDDEEEDDENEDSQVSYLETKPSPIPYVSEHSWSHLRSPRAAELPSDKRTQYSLPSARQTAFSTSTPYSRPIPKQRPEEDSKMIPLWLKLLAVGISLTLIYLIYVNMEPPAITNIPESNKVEV